MIVRVGNRVYSDRAVDLDVTLPPAPVAEAVRTGSAQTDGMTIEVVARSAGPLHARVGCIKRAVALRPRTALAEAARSRGWTTVYDPQLAAARQRLSATTIETPEPDLDRHRRRIAETSAEADTHRERVAEARGRALVNEGNDPDQTAGLEEAIRELSEVETAAAAAQQAHDQAREEMWRLRDQLRRRLRLADEVGRLERRARVALVERAKPAYRRAVEAVPEIGLPRTPFDAPDDAMALAVAAVGCVAAPVVLRSGRFSNADRAASWLRAPVIRLEP